MEQYFLNHESSRVNKSINGGKIKPEKHTKIGKSVFAFVFVLFCFVFMILHAPQTAHELRAETASWQV